jgi:thiamine biosynthesis lipoprotein
VTAGTTTRSMGGRLAIYVQAADEDAPSADLAVRRVAARVDRWAARLTRHDPASELSSLNADPAGSVVVRPTLGAALAAGRAAMAIGGGSVDIALLEARLAAEAGSPAPLPLPRRWTLETGARGVTAVTRPPGMKFDLGGVGKGWIADRAVRLLDRYPSALVDADGDLALVAAPGHVWTVAIDDPRVPDGLLATLRIGSNRSGSWGIATSGTSIHRWDAGGRTGHHLIDPRTGEPARTDVVQATVVADSALHAETYAKAAAIAGSVAGFALLDRAPVRGAVILLADGRVLALPKTLALLAA